MWIYGLKCAIFDVPDVVPQLHSPAEGVIIQSPGEKEGSSYFSPDRRRAEDFKFYYMFIYNRSEVYYLFHVESARNYFKNTPALPLWAP